VADAYTGSAGGDMSRIRQDELGSSLRTARRNLGKSLSEVASEVGTSKSYLSQLERGLITNPKAGMLQRICLALGVEVVFGCPEKDETALALGYASPLGFEEPSAAAQDGAESGAVNTLKRALSDATIPLKTRKLLERQVRALVETVRQDGNTA